MIGAKSKTRYSHKALVRVARRWLTTRCAIVTTEIATSAYEQPDALGFEADGTSHLIECKTSLNDFHADKGKVVRAHASLGIGKHRYYLVPEEIAGRINVPEGWNLIVWNGRFVSRVVVGRPFMERNTKGEMQILISLMRRIGIKERNGVSVKCYSIDRDASKRRATLGVMAEE